MKLFSLLLIALILFNSCGRKSFLEKNNMVELNYLLSDIDEKKADQKCLQIQNFNRLYNCLNIFRLKDSSLVFTCHNTEKSGDDNEFLVQFINDSMRIYRNDKNYGYTSHGMDIIGYQMTITDAIKTNKFDTIPFLFEDELRNCFTSKKTINYSLEYTTLLQSRNKKYFYYYHFANCREFLFSFIYERTIKNSIINPLPPICDE